MTPREVRDRLDLTQDQWARILGVNANTVSRWERGAAQPPRRERQIMAGVERLGEVPALRLGARLRTILGSSEPLVATSHLLNVLTGTKQEKKSEKPQ